MKTYDINSVEELLKTQESVAFLTSGTSMRPLLRTHKDIVIIAKPKHPLCVGEVPLYKKAGIQKLVLHRIIGVKSNGTYITRGDNTYHNEQVKPCDVVGVMTSLYRSGKYIDCGNSFRYKTYVKVNRLFYPVRWMWHTKVRPFLRKIYKSVIK